MQFIVRQLKNVESHRNWLGLVSLLIILLYLCEGLCLLTSYRYLIEPCGAQSSSELVLRFKNLSVNPKLQDVGASEAVHLFSSRLGFILHSEIFKGSFVKTSSCTMLKMGEQIVWLFFSPLLEYWLCQKGLHEAETPNVISKAWNCQTIPEKVSLTVPQT